MTGVGASAPRPRDLTADDLVLSHFSLGRDHPIEDRIEAASAAGFAGIGLFVGQYRKLLESGMTHGTARRPARRVEPVSRRDRGAGRMGDASTVGRLLGDGVGRLGPRRRIRRADTSRRSGRTRAPLDEAAEQFGALCDRAADHGAVIGLEFLPFTNIVDAADALAIVERAGRPNGGVCVDIWHHARGANDLELIRSIPAELITGVQMSDGPAAPVLDDYKDDCLRHRVPPGEGTFGAETFVATLLEMGVGTPVVARGLQR